MGSVAAHVQGARTPSLARASSQKARAQAQPLAGAVHPVFPPTRACSVGGKNTRSCARLAARLGVSLLRNCGAGKLRLRFFGFFVVRRPSALREAVSSGSLAVRSPPPPGSTCRAQGAGPLRSREAQPHLQCAGSPRLLPRVARTACSPWRAPPAKRRAHPRLLTKVSCARGRVPGETPAPRGAA